MKPINNLPKLTRHKLDFTEYTSTRSGQITPLHVHFVPGREVTRVAANGFIFSNPLAKPLLCPVQVRVSRFFCPIANYYGTLYDDEPDFDRNLTFHTLSLANLRDVVPGPSSLAWRLGYPVFGFSYSVDSSDLVQSVCLNRLLSYWDIVRTFYSYTNQDLVCIGEARVKNSDNLPGPNRYAVNRVRASTFYKFFRNLRNQPEGVAFSNDVIESLIPDATVGEKNIFKSMFNGLGFWGNTPHLLAGEAWSSFSSGYFGVMPTAPDALTRLFPNGAGTSALVQVSTSAEANMSWITVPDITRGIKLQNLMDIINASKKTFSNYMKIFFGRAVERKNRPVLLDSFQFTFNTSALNSTQGENLAGGLGQFVGVGQASLSLPRKRYHFDTYGYMFDILTIRPIHAWTGVGEEDTLDTNFNQLFNEKFNEIGFVYKELFGEFGGSSGWWPCWNEYRVGYDRVSGQMSSFVYRNPAKTDDTRENYSTSDSFYVYTNNYIRDDVGNSLHAPALSQLFMDLYSSNGFFSRPFDENFFVRMDYSYTTLNLIGHRFANSARV